MASGPCPHLLLTLACCKGTETKRMILTEEILMKYIPETSGEGERERERERARWREKEKKKPN